MGAGSIHGVSVGGSVGAQGLAAMNPPSTFAPIARRVPSGPKRDTWSYEPGWNRKLVEAMRLRGDLITCIKGAELLGKRGAGLPEVVTWKRPAG
jgi:hypothetical protein